MGTRAPAFDPATSTGSEDWDWFLIGRCGFSVTGANSLLCCADWSPEWLRELLGLIDTELGRDDPAEARYLKWLARLVAYTRRRRYYGWRGPLPGTRQLRAALARLLAPRPWLAPDRRPAGDLSPAWPLLLARTTLTAAPPARVPAHAGTAG